MIRILQKDNRLTKIIFAVVIGAACLTMVITLVPGIFDNADTVSAADTYATVRTPGFWGRFETPSTVKNADVEALAHRLLEQQHYPDFLLSYMAQRAGTMLVSQQVLLREADRLGLQVSDADLAHELQYGPFGQALFPGGKFIGDDAYMSFVQNQFNMSRTEFESRVKEEMEVNRLQSYVTGGVNVSDNEVRESYLAQGTKVKFEYATIQASDVAQTVNPSDADLQTYFAQNKTKYAAAVPETRRINYVAFTSENVPGGTVSVSGDEIQQYYNAHQDQYTVKDQVRVRHILIAVPQGADAATDAKAKAKAEDLLKQIKAGADFAALAKANSDDPGSKAQGGELGFLQHGATVPEFDAAAFSLPVGQVSDVIKTQFGYHILQVEEKQSAHVKSVDEVKDQIEPILEQQKDLAAEQGFATQFATEAKSEGLAAAASKHGQHVILSNYLSAGSIVAGLSDSSNILPLVFAAKPGDAPQAVSTGDGYAVFQLADILPAHAPVFADYKAHVLADYRQEKVPQLMASKLSALAARAKVLGDLAKAAKEQKVTVQTSDLVGRDGQVPGIGAMTGQASVAFSMAKGDISQPINTGTSGIVLSVVDKQEPAPDEIAANFDKTRDQLLEQKREEMFGVFAGTLSQKYEALGAIKYSKQAKTAPTPFGN
jgi:peptidyl-prolyl cis-trans isomerase D